MLQNVHRIEGDVTYITLTRGKEAIINTVDLEHVLHVRWYAELVHRSGDCYARGKPRGREKSVTMHRYIMDVKDDGWVDHINFDTLDNRRENLRVVTPSENRIHQRRKPGQTGLLHITVVRPSNGYFSYYITMMRDGVRKAKSYPYTPAGLRLAQELVAKWEEDFSYEPPRTIQRRPLRSNLPASNTSETGPHASKRDKHIQEYRNSHHIEREDSDTITRIALSRGQEAIIDIVDIEKLSKYSWRATPNEMGGYYACASVEGKTTYMHRFLLNAPNGMYVDHINHDTLDNRQANLRLVTNQENNTNRDGAYNTSKTGIRGVSVHKTATTNKGRNGLMYVFRCHCVTCKVAKYFPYTEEGLQEAKVFAEAHYAAMNTK